MARLVAIRRGGYEIWRAPQYHARRVDVDGPRFRWLRPGRAVEIEVPPAERVEVYAMGGPRPVLLRREQAQHRPGPVIPFRLRPVVATLELVVMMSLATRALEENG